MTFHDSFFFHDFPGFSMTVGTLYVGVFCRRGRGDWTDMGELGGECAGESEGGED